jgi:hypothetical protein
MLVLTLRKPITGALYNLSQDRFRIARSDINGFGLFAKRSFAASDFVSQLQGSLKRKPRKTLPNWIGIGPGLWIDPKLPLQNINHSCAANVAFGRNRRLYALREIAAGEEITLDYSTTEADANWSMPCFCKAANCRKTLYAIQFSFVDAVAPPASPLMQRIWRKCRLVSAPEAPAFSQLSDEKLAGAKPMIPAQ